LPGKLLEAFSLAEIGKPDLHIRAVLKAGGQTRQMLRINIRDGRNDWFSAPDSA
jgi:hypothetical protein